MFLFKGIHLCVIIFYTVFHDFEVVLPQTESNSVTLSTIIPYESSEFLICPSLISDPDQPVCKRNSLLRAPVTNPSTDNELMHTDTS